jgi:hypothetical protein
MAQDDRPMVESEVTSLREALLRLGIERPLIDLTITQLAQVSVDYRCRRDQAARSPRIAAVVGQLTDLVTLANRAARGEQTRLPADLLPEVFDALAGRFPFSPLELLRIAVASSLDKVDDALPGHVRTAVTGATVTQHVLHAAMRPWPPQRHFVGARISSFPAEAAEAYFFGELPKPVHFHLRQRLEKLIADDPALSVQFFHRIATAVRGATLQVGRQNPGRRTLYGWSEPACDARLVVDVCDTVLSGQAVSLTGARSALREIVDILRRGIIWDDASASGEDCESRALGHEDDLRNDIFAGMISVWRWRAEHRQILRRLDEMICQCRRSTRSLPLTCELLENCYSKVSASVRELERRAEMGDPSGSDPSSARASGTPGRIIKVLPLLGAKTQLQLLRGALRACRDP